jgi:hypothetical protein
VQVAMNSLFRREFLRIVHIKSISVKESLAIGNSLGARNQITNTAADVDPEASI